MMPFLKLSIESARRMWQISRSDGLINLAGGNEWKLDRRWLKFISDRKWSHTPKRVIKVSVGWRYPLPTAGLDITTNNGIV